MKMTGIEFEEQYNNSYYETITYYFKAPVELLDEFDIEYPEDTENCTISMEFPKDKVEASECCVAISPTVDGCDIDYTDLFDLPYEDIEKLMAIADSVEDKIIIDNG